MPHRTCMQRALQPCSLTAQLVGFRSDWYCRGAIGVNGLATVPLPRQHWSGGGFASVSKLFKGVALLLLLLPLPKLLQLLRLVPLPSPWSTLIHSPSAHRPVYRSEVI